eukprot:COSAG03_NODE_11583_length_585_cov_1.331276_1_plen_83_part_10
MTGMFESSLLLYWLVLVGTVLREGPYTYGSYISGQFKRSCSEFLCKRMKPPSAVPGRRPRAGSAAARPVRRLTAARALAGGVG